MLANQACTSAAPVARAAATGHAGSARMQHRATTLILMMRNHIADSGCVSLTDPGLLISTNRRNRRDEMSRAKPLVIVTRRLPEPTERELSALFETRLNARDAAMDAGALTAAVQSADVLVPTVGDGITREVIEAAGPQLRLIANFGVGFNHIDVAAAARRGIAV